MAVAEVIKGISSLLPAERDKVNLDNWLVLVDRHHGRCAIFASGKLRRSSTQKRGEWCAHDDIDDAVARYPRCYGIHVVTS
jgi:hypothetical protein